MLNPTKKAEALAALRAVLVLAAWLVMMAGYLTIYDVIEQNAVPVNLPSKDFNTRGWDQGYFQATGAFEDQAAISPGDRLLPQANSITCDKSPKTCTVTTAQIFDHHLSIDTSSFDIASWTDQQITFADDAPICVTNAYVIDRAAQTMTLLVRKRAVIPDYAAKSELHPCDNIKDANIDLADGFKVSWHAKMDFEVRNGFYFHAALTATNVAFFATVVLWWRRSRAEPQAEAPA